MGALKERFDPSSRRALYLAELLGRKKRRGEDWAAFAEDLNTLVDRAYPELQDDAREQLALTHYLGQLEHPQLAFSVKQRRPKTVDEAVRGAHTSRTSGCSERAAGRHDDPSAAGCAADGHARIAFCSPAGGNAVHSASSSRTGSK